MKGEFMGADGQTYHIDSIALREVCSEPSTTISGSLDGGARLVWKLHLHPSHRDFPAAVAALQALIRPSLDPRSGRVLAMGEVLDEDYIDGRRCRYVSDQPWTRQS